MQITVIKIDVFAKTVYPVSIDANKLQDLYDAIGCQTFDVVARHLNGDALYVDDEALLQEPQAPCFLLEGYHSPICGNAVLVGSDHRGNSITPLTTLEEMQPRVHFVGPLNLEPHIVFISL